MRRSEIQTCSRCIYDSRIPRISFDEEGLCNYCRQYDQMMDEYPTGAKGLAIIEKEVEQAKKDGEENLMMLLLE